MPESEIKKELLDLGISTEDSIHEFHPHVRDNKNISVLKCDTSGVLFLSESSDTDYKEKKGFNYHSEDHVFSREKAKELTIEDDTRRATQFKQFITNKKWLDIGTGNGGILDLLSPYAKETSAVEPQNDKRKALEDYKVYSNIDEVDETFEVITMFHVLEHLSDPVGMLKKVHSKLDGTIIIEVPHANDFLIQNSEAFKDFTFWSEHLMLHTKESLRKFLEVAGFKNIRINGYQIYPLANHLHWLAKGKPGGHDKWKELSNPEIDTAYSNLLKELDKTDTLIAIAESK